MGSSWFVEAETDRLDLTDGNYLIVKRELNLEEERRVLNRQLKTMTLGTMPELDPEQVGLTQLFEYVVEWGGPAFADKQGRTLPFSESAVSNLHPSKFKIISDALAAHIAVQDKRRDAEKNDTTDAINSGPTSPSVN